MNNIIYFTQTTLNLFIAFIFISNLPIVLAIIDECTIIGNALSLLGLNTSSKPITNKGTVPPCCGIAEFVVCENTSEGNHVTQLHFRDKDFNGKDISKVIEEISNLPYLRYISLANDKITGSIPQNFNKIKGLTNLSLRMNQLTGTIPENLGELTNLVYLDLSENNLHGEIPKSFGTLTNLKVLKLNNNGINGAIPYSFQNLENLEQLQLNNTAIEGYVPEFPKLKNCSFANSNICHLKQSNLNCQVEISECTDEDIKNTNKINGHEDNKKGNENNEIVDNNEKNENKNSLSTLSIFLIIITFFFAILIIGLLIFKRINNRKEEKENNEFINKLNQNVDDIMKNEVQEIKKEEEIKTYDDISFSLSNNNITDTQTQTQNEDEMALTGNVNNGTRASLLNIQHTENDYGVSSSVISSDMKSNTPYLNRLSYMSVNTPITNNTQLNSPIIPQISVPAPTLNRNSFTVSQLNSMMGNSPVIETSPMASTSPMNSTLPMASTSPMISNSPLLGSSAGITNSQVIGTSPVMGSPTLSNYYMPNYVVVDQNSPEYINTMNAMLNNMKTMNMNMMNNNNTIPPTIPLSHLNSVNSVNGHNTLSIHNSTQPIVPNRQRTVSRRNEDTRRRTKEEEARIERETNNNDDNDDDQLPSYEDI
jgi:hypothetical protein